METFIKTIIYIHAFFGGIGLIAGLGSMLVKKGSPSHKKTGKIFSVGMFISSAISLFICCFPGHYNLFLFAIGLFTIYLVISGNRMLIYKKKVSAKTIKTDFIISSSMMVVSLIMTLLGILLMLQKVDSAILFVFFGLLGFWMSFKDLKFYRNLEKNSQKWLVKHIGKMVGALIASVTAFIVAGMQLGNLYTWILPSVIGSFVIFYWIRKVNKNKKATV